MATPPIPVKTADGQAELVNRQRRLSQRHRTMLLLVDGRRTEQEVKTLARKAGATESCFGELVELGLIAVPQPTDPMTSTIPISPPSPPADDDVLHVDIPIPDDLPPASPAPQSPARASRPARDDDLEPMLPASRTLQPDSVLTDSMLGEQKMTDSMLDEFESLGATRTEDSSLEEARGILLRAVRAEAPLTGSLTMLRLRRARTRIELSDLIDEVESRIIKPYRSLAAQQVLRRARHLLDTRTNPLAAS